MMPAAKHGDPQLGVDIHLCVVPPSPSPVPLPTPHMSIVFDPFDYIPYIGATVTVCGMKRATAGTNATVVHIPPGFPFAPKLPDKDDEIFMGSSTVVADGDPFSFIAVPVLGCQVAGMISIPRLKKKGSGKKLCLLPTTFNVAIPSTVFVGGPPTISLMGMAFKGAFAALGKFAKSGLFKRMRQKLFGFLPPGFLKCKVLRAEPVNILTGEVSVQQEDFTVPGRIPIQWHRAYTSSSDHEGHCGYGWETPADTRLEIDPIDGIVCMRHPAIGPLFFNRLPISPGADHGELEIVDGARLTDEPDEYLVHTKEDRIYHFPKALAQKNRRGGLEYPIGRLADLCGNWLEFERRRGKLTGINESAGRRINIDIDAGRIRKVSLTVPGNDEYHTFVRYEYDDAGDLAAAIDALGHPYRFAYDEHHMVRHTDRNGLSFYYEYDKTGEDWRVVHSWGDGGLYDYQFEYIDALNERRITDSLSNVSIVKLDERGLPISEIDPLGGITFYGYDEAGRPTLVIDQDGHRTEYEHDARGNLLKVIRPDGKAIQTVFDATNKAIAIVDPNGSEWQQNWDAHGLLVEQTSPLGNTSRYEYDARGQLVAFTNPRGARTELRFDDLGNLSGVIDALGHRTRLAFDVLGNLSHKLDRLNRRTTYRYDVKARLTDIGLPSSSTIHYTYDSEDNIVAYVDENGMATKLEYSGLGEISTRLLADGHTIRYQYDTEERLIGVTNQRGETFHLKRDALGRVVEEVDYWGQSRVYSYSASGYLQRSIDPSGRVIDYVTDALGRILKRMLPDQERSAIAFQEIFEFDANGSLVACANPHVSIERTYDAEQRLVEEKQGGGFIIRNTYDGVGNRIERHTELRHDGATTRHSVRYTYDLLDQAVEIAIDDHAPIKIERDAVGNIVAQQLSPALRREVEYSADGYLTRQRVRSAAGTIIDVAYGYDAAGNLTERRDTDFGIDKYTYDPVGRITRHFDPQGKLKGYLNDPAGDRFPLQVVADGTETVAASGKVTDAERSREGTYEGVLYRFDRSGNVVERHDEHGKLKLRWDAHGRLIESLTNGTSTQYRYDPLGRRIAKCTADHHTGFTWDGDLLLGDAFAQQEKAWPASVLREWVHFPGTFEPLAMVGGDANAQSVLLYQNDPNGCPIRLINASGDVRWAARYTALGQAARQHGNPIDSPIRLQGQYADYETGLSYTRHRYYDTHAGRFIGQDPIGLAGGVNVYDYGKNIHGWIDPVGLNCVITKSLPDPTNRFGHFSVDVSSGANKLHTEQVITDAKLNTTIANVFDETPVTQVTVHLPNPDAAMAYQKSMLGVSTGTYDVKSNSCVDHVCNVLRAGGLDVPAGAKEQFKYLKGLGLY